MSNLIVQTVARAIIPFIQVYGVYIVFYGHLSPGGGFSGGSIIGASLILFTLSFGMKKTLIKMPHEISERIESGVILWYVGLGLIGIIRGYNFLTNKEAGFFMGETGNILSAGIIPLITAGIAFKVASTILTLFHTIIKEE